MSEEHGVSLAGDGTDHAFDLTSTVVHHDPEKVALKRTRSRIHNASSRDTGSRSSATSDSHRTRKGSGGSMHLDLPHLPLPAETALAALQLLPTPLIVLSSLKTVVLANEAMGRLLGLNDNTDLPYNSVTDTLHGQTLSQIGIDMMSDGVPCWVSWEKFLDNLATGSSDEMPSTPGQLKRLPSGDTTPTLGLRTQKERKTATLPATRGRSSVRKDVPVQDTAVDVIISSSRLQSPLAAKGAQRQHTAQSPGVQATCRMIITIWDIDDHRFFTLTFTASGNATTRSQRHVVHTRRTPRAASSTSTRSTHSTQSHTPCSSTTSSGLTSPTELLHNMGSMLPNGAPSNCTNTAQFTDFQKVIRMKDAMLNAMEIPVIAMWKDESVVFPNQAARKLLAVTADPTSEDSYDFMSRFKPWTADFSRELDEAENPIIKLCRTQRGFSRWQIGLKNKASKQSRYEVSGHPVFDDKTGEFFAGLVAFKDVTEYTDMIAKQTAESAAQFELICDTMPQMIWTTRPDGFHDYFSQRWYDYTGLKPEECRGLNWVLPFHPDDLAIAGKRWMHSLATGDEYLTEYRCMSKDGVWRWMLGRALPLRDTTTGKIVRWFGTCTDIQDVIDARETSQRAQNQLVDALHHAQMTMWVVNTDRKITFFEGKVEDSLWPEQFQSGFIGVPAVQAFKGHLDVKRLDAAMDAVLSGISELEMIELHDEHDRWFRLRLVPQRGEPTSHGEVDQADKTVVGIVGTSMEVTAMKKKEQENVKLLANETAAKEASKMKSSFLANMSHEIRTPIAGVLGMSELLMETDLDTEQADFAQNIQRSANSLLTVINDILDFSKIESGRLDIEEVQFSLPVVLKDVAKMLSYAAARKNLEFTSEINLGQVQEMPLLGDPGRIRQILTNLLTNSIKFTSDGYVKMSAKVLENQPESVVIEFVVEDTGIGIEEEVKKRLFTPFSQADSSTARRFGGTGLGLTISKNLVDLMHGQIWLDSKLDQGTKAVFRIPLKKTEFAGTGAVPMVEVGALPDRMHSELSLSGDGPGGKRLSSPPIISSQSRADSITAHGAMPELDRRAIHILVVEDNTVNQQIAIRFLQSLNFSVSAVWNGREALEYLLKAASPSMSSEEKAKYIAPAVILMDCQMPVLDGYHATHILRHHAPWSEMEVIQKAPIIAMTASAIQGDREKCERAGMDDYLAKPVKKPVLEQMILKWVAGNVQPAAKGAFRGPKPSLSRSGTEHSSSCADLDSIAHEVLSKPSAVAAVASSLTSLPPTSPQARPLRHEKRRPSLPPTMMTSDMTRFETMAEQGARRAAQEEQAMDLRDAKLIAATDSFHGRDTCGHLSTSARVEASKRGPSLATSPLPRKYSQESAEYGVMALTEENVERFNAVVSPCLSHVSTNGADDYFSQPLPGERTDLDKSTPGRVTSVMAVDNIPGPPPEVAGVGSVRLLTAKDIPPPTPSPGRDSLKVSAVKREASVQETMTKGRQDMPTMLKTIGRHKSDITVKPSEGVSSPTRVHGNETGTKRKSLKSPALDKKR